jgi:putative ABC transport system permease protein
MGMQRFFRRRRWDEERARELDAHLAIEIEENLQRGMTPNDARDAARRKLGNVTRIREDIYDMNTVPILDTARLDLRDAMRQLRRRPLVTALALLLLTIGIGASATAFSVAYGVLLRSLPYPEPDRLAVLWAHNGGQRGQISLPDFYDLRSSVPFADAAALASGRVTLSGAAGADADRVMLVQAEAGLLRLLGTRPLLGRLPVEADEGRSVAVISERVWRRTFHADPAVVGRPITVSGSPYSIIGVFDRSFAFELTVPSGGVGAGFVVKDVDLWTPFNLVSGIPLSREVSSCEVIVRLKPGETLATTQSAVDVLASRLARTYPGTNRDRRFVLTPLRDQVVEATSPIVVMGLVGALLLLVIACANVASVFLADLPARRRDFALRAALGAGRGRLIRQLVIESGLLAAAGSALGLLVARSGVAWLKTAAELPRVDAIRFDLPVTAAIVVTAMAVSMIARLAPLARLRESRDDLRSSVSAYSASAPRLRRTLVGVQVALAVVLSSTALLLGLSLRRLIAVDPGFAPSHTVAVRVSAYATRYPDKAATARFVNDLVNRVAILPGVNAAAAGQSVPLAGAAGGTSIGVEGQPRSVAERPTAGWFTVTPGYFRALGVSMIEGREFSPVDLDRASHQTVINQTLARLLFGSQNPIGRRLSYGPDSAVSDWHEIVGVAADMRQATLAKPPDPAAYDLFGQHWGRSVYLIARGNADPYTLVPAIRQVVRQMDSEAPVFDVRSLDDVVNGAVAPRRLATGFAVGIAAVSLLLAAIGLYGLLASSVASRTKELGIRRALGSSTARIVRLVLGEAAVLVLLGVFAGVTAAIALARPIQAQLFNVQATDLRVLATVAISLAMVAGVAAYLPVSRAAAVEPAIALRDE